MQPTADQVIFFDGGSSPNPGPMVLAIVHGDRACLQHPQAAQCGNNEAEFRAAIAALDYAASLGLRRPTLSGDSAAVIDALSNRRPPKPGRLTGLYEQCRVRDVQLGGVTWQRAPRSNPAGRLIQVERRKAKAIRRRARQTRSVVA